MGINFSREQCCVSRSDDEYKYTSAHEWLCNYALTKTGRADMVPQGIHYLHEYPASGHDAEPSNYQNQQDTAPCDVFYIHPTLITSADKCNVASHRAPEGMKSWAASQASVFNGTCRIYAPYYNHAVLSSKDIKASWVLAYEDIQKAFKAYLDLWNDGRPFYICGHAQGSVMALRLMKEFLKPGEELKKQFVGAYLCGLVVYKDQLPEDIPVGEYAGVPGTIACWSTVADTDSNEHSSTQLSSRPGHEAIATDPTHRVKPVRHQGSLGVDADKKVVLCDGMVHESRVDNGLLKINGHQRFLPYYKNKNDYHSYDVHLFWGDLRLSIAQQYFLYKDYYGSPITWSRSTFLSKSGISLTKLTPDKFPPDFQPRGEYKKRESKSEDVVQQVDNKPEEVVQEGENKKEQDKNKEEKKEEEVQEEGENKNEKEKGEEELVIVGEDDNEIEKKETSVVPSA